MPRWIKLTLKIIAGFLGLVALLMISLAIYINTHKQALIKTVGAQLSDHIYGELKIGNMAPELLRGFPNISVSLKKVVLRDSLWKMHHHDLLNAESIYVEVNALSLLQNKPKINQVTIENGNIYLFTDSLDYSNASAIARQDTNKGKKGEIKIKHLGFSNVRFTFEHKWKNKLFTFDIKELSARLHYNATGWNASVSINTLIKDFAFNTLKGSFVKNQRLKANLKLQFNSANKVLSLKEQPLYLNDEKIFVSGNFGFGAKPVPFKLTFASKSIKFKTAKSFLTPAIASKLEGLDLENPVKVNTILYGYMKFRDTPWVRVYWDIKDNTLYSPAGEVSHASFRGMYDNEVKKGLGHKDDNGAISLKNMTGEWEGIPFTADTVNVFNLTRPVLFCRFKSNFQLDRLNSIMGQQTFRFTAGSANMNFVYKGGINEDDTTHPYVNGSIEIKDGSVTYLPRSLSFVHTNATLYFTGDDLFLKNVRVQGRESVLFMEGSIKNFLNLYYSAPDKIVIDWKVRSPKINLNEFRSFLGKRQYSVAPRVQKNNHRKLNRLLRQLDVILDQSNVNLNVAINQLVYRKFEASNINATVILKRVGILLPNISLNHAGGTLQVSGDVNPSGNSNIFNLNAKLNNVHVQEIFYSFENFGQDALSDKNIRGNLFADANIRGNLKQDGGLAPGSLNGYVNFDLRNGALLNFEPFEKIGKYVFRKRNLSNITFNNLKNRLDIDHNKIIINPMQIESSALNMFIQGVYGIPRGTNIDMEIPLRNPKKDEFIADENVRLARSRKGIVLYLKATDEGEDKVKIKWNPKGKKIETKDTLGIQQ